MKPYFKNIIPALLILLAPVFGENTTLNLPKFFYYFESIFFIILITLIINRYEVFRGKKIVYFRKVIGVIIIVMLLVSFIHFKLYEIFISYLNLYKTLSLILLGIFLGMIIYHFVLRFFMKYRFFQLQSEFWENVFDRIIGHRRYKLVHDFPSYCKNGEYMISRAMNKFLLDSQESMCAVQLHPQRLSSDDNKALQSYLRKTYDAILSTNWNYNRLVYLSTLNEEHFTNSFILSFEFIRTLLLEYFFCKDDYEDANNKLKLNDKYIFGIGREIYKNEFFRNQMKQSINKTYFAYTSMMDEFIDFASKLDLHLPPGDEFSIAFTSEDEFKGFIRVSNQNYKKFQENNNGRNRNVNNNSDVKSSFKKMFKKQFDGNNNQFTSYKVSINSIIEVIKSNLKIDNNEHNDLETISIEWQNKNIDKNIYDILFDKAKSRMNSEMISASSEEKKETQSWFEKMETEVFDKLVSNGSVFNQL